MAVLPHQLPMLSSYSAGCSPGQHTNPPTPPSQPCPGVFLSSRDGAPGEGRWGEITSSGSDQTPVGPHPGWEQDARPWEAGSPQSQCSVSQSALPAGSQVYYERCIRLEKTPRTSALRLSGFAISVALFERFRAWNLYLKR